MIVGVGIDLVEIERIESAYKKFGPRFLERVLTPEESTYCLSHKNPGPYIAARFAAKEAVSKAFGTGIGKAIGWRHIEVRHKESGQPYIAFNGRGLELFGAVKANVIHLSLSHTNTNAVAVAILERVSDLTDA
jgi:holo-[acyl-carrier protein] synthase